MKWFTLVVMAALLSVLCMLAGCSGRNHSVSNTQTEIDMAHAEPIYLTEWPDNEYTLQIPEAVHGKIDYVYDLSSSGRYALSLKDISEDESKENLKSI